MSDPRWAHDHPLWRGLTLPDGWTVLHTGRTPTPFVMISSLGLRVGVSVLPLSGGGLPDNIRRWQKQLGLSERERDQRTHVKRLALDSADVSWVEIGGKNTEPSHGTMIVAAVVDLQDRTLFFKITGPYGWMMREKPALRTWIESSSFGELIERFRSWTPAP